MAEDDGTERRTKDAVAIATLSVQMSNLAAAMIRIEAGQSELLRRLEVTEHKSEENCRSCSTWTRLTILEQFKASAEERLKKVDDHETRLRWIEPRMAAAAALFSALAFLAGKVL
jgi:hypothetical protein